MPPCRMPQAPPHPSQHIPARPPGFAERAFLLVRILFWPVRAVLMPLWRAANLWIGAEGLRMSAAMSFYGMLSLAPLLILIVAGLGWWLDRSLLEATLVAQAQEVVGAKGAEVVRQAMESARQPASGAWASIFAAGLLLSGATGVFAELEAAFERIWYQGRTPPPTPWWHTAYQRLRGVTYILALGVLLLASLVATTVFRAVEHWASQWHLLVPLLKMGNETLSVIFSVALFTGLMRISGGAKPRLLFLVVGACVGAALFAVGKHLMAYYLSTAAVVSAYGAAGSLVVVLMWIYFSSAVLLFSAGCAQALAEQAEAQP